MPGGYSVGLNRACLLFLLLTSSGVNLPAQGRAFNSTSETTSSPVCVVLWFDTEDYILPESDDAALRVAELLTRKGVRATFKIVGEKARSLERRGRGDVIAALSRHDIGYHSNLHSQQPTPALRLSNMGWQEGIQEFDRTERAGFEAVQRIFGVAPICYGQPGNAWVPQSYPVLKTWGVPLYLDEGSHVGVRGQPFWYGGILNVFNMAENVTRVQLQKDADLDQAKTQFENIYRRLRASGGGLVSIYYHPCEFVHREFWDAVNFSHGANPPPEQWRKPALKSAPEIEQGFRNFEGYIDYLKSIAQVKFVTGSELADLYRDEAPRQWFSREEVLRLAQAVQREITYRSWPNFSLSAGEIFSLLNCYMSNYLETQRVPVGGGFQFVYGPARRKGNASKGLSLTTHEFATACLDVQSALKRNPQIPSEIWAGSHALTPADYLATLAAAIEALITAGKLRVTVPVQSGNFTAEQYVADDSPSIWAWAIFPEGFHSSQIMELAKLQAWTLKPAILRK
jgi:hypothetical protein